MPKQVGAVWAVAGMGISPTAARANARIVLRMVLPFLRQRSFDDRHVLAVHRSVAWVQDADIEPFAAVEQV